MQTIFNWFGDDWTRVKNHCRTTDNGVLVRCTERKAQGILSIDGGTVYQLYEKEALVNATMTAVVITTTEYLSLVDTLDKEDTEDTDPEVPDAYPAGWQEVV